MKIVHNIINSLGFYKLSELTDEQIDQLFVDRFDIESTISDEDAKEMFEHLSRVPHYKEYLMATIGSDMKRHFMAQPEERPLIQGAVLRTRYLLSHLTQDKEKLNKLKLPRYS